MGLTLTSPAFAHEGFIPDTYTGLGQNASPPLAWTGSPANTVSYAIIAEDTDTPVGTLTHWVVYNIPGHKRDLQEAVPRQKVFPNGMIQGRNGLWRTGYMGPNPPWGKHRYYFTLYALDTLLTPTPILNKKRLLQAMTGHILEQAQIMGYYDRKRSCKACL